MLETTERVKYPSSRVVIVFPNGTLLTSETTNDVLTELKNSWFINNQDVDAVRDNNQTFNKQMMLPGQDVEVMMVGAPIKNNEGAVFVRSEEHTSELQSRGHLVCSLLLE